MGKMLISGLSELAADFDLDLLSDEITDEMLKAEAAVVLKAQRETARTMLAGDYSAGALAESMDIGRIAHTPTGGKRVDIIFVGRRAGRIGAPEYTSNATIAYINEFGKTNQPARPFIAAAIEKSADEAVAAAAKIYDRYLSIKNL